MLVRGIISNFNEIGLSLSHLLANLRPANLRDIQVLHLFTEEDSCLRLHTIILDIQSEVIILVLYIISLHNKLISFSIPLIDHGPYGIVSNFTHYLGGQLN